MEKQNEAQRIGTFKFQDLIDGAAKEGKLYMYVPDEIRKSVIFVTYFDGQNYIPLGTAFLVSIEAGNFNRSFVYLVTAKHVIVEARNRCVDQSVWLRVNRPQATSDYLKCPIEVWQYHEEDTSVDVAAVQWTISDSQVEFVTIPHTMAVTDDVIATEKIGIGDEVFLTGLFVNHQGKKRNLPIVRVGNIALMPEEKIATKDFGSIEAYLVEARSIGGLSGSPVFVHLGPVRVVDHQVKIQGKLFYWLGLMHGHWNMPVPMDENDDTVGDTIQGEKLNMGIAIVVPAAKIVEVLNKPFFSEARKNALKRLEAETLPTEDVTEEGGNHPTLSEEGFEIALQEVSFPLEPKSKEEKSERSG